MEENQQEMMYKFSMYEQQIKHLQQQLQAIEQSVFDLQEIHLGLDDLKGKEGEEIMAPLGRGIFVKAKLLSENLVVDIGEKNFVTKNIDSTKKMISTQLEKLKEVGKEIDLEMRRLSEEIASVVGDAQNKNNCGCEEHSENCSCEDECDCKTN